MNGVAMQRMARHLEQCEPCGVEFAAWRQVQDALGSLGPAKAPESLQAQLVAAIAEQRAKGVHLTWHQQLARLWQVTLAPMALRAAMGTAAALVLVGGLSLVAMSAPASVEANDEPLGAVNLAALSVLAGSASGYRFRSRYADSSGSEHRRRGPRVRLQDRVRTD